MAVFRNSGSSPISLRENISYVTLIVLQCFQGPALGVDTDCSRPWNHHWNAAVNSVTPPPAPASTPLLLRRRLQPPAAAQLPVHPLDVSDGGGCSRSTSCTTDVQQELEQLLNENNSDLA